MSKHPPDLDDRLQQQYRRLGTRDPACVSCSESNPLCLELHHLAAQKHHGDLAIVCRNCHRKLTDQQHDHVPSSSFAANDQMANIGRYLLGLADLLLMIVGTLRTFAQWLICQAQKQRVP